MFKINSLEKLIHELNRLPGVGPKTAQRLAYHILRTPDLSDQLQTALVQVQESVRPCPQCFSFTDEPNHCRFCTDSNRRDDLLCVVEEPADILRIESSGAFRGRYHVLHGAISPLDRIGPEHLRIRELLERISSSADASNESLPDSQADSPTNSRTNPKINEVILALDPDLEGDTTVLYLARELAKIRNEQGQQIKITRIASGVPIGSDIDYADDRTLNRALENRTEL